MATLLRWPSGPTEVGWGYGDGTGELGRVHGGSVVGSRQCTRRVLLQRDGLGFRGQGYDLY